VHVIGIVGTGEMGWRMGKLLANAGHSIVCYDIRPEALQRSRQSGFRIADSIASLGEQSDIVITCVTDGAALRAVVEGDVGLAAALHAGKAVIDTTSAEPWITEEVAKMLSARKIPFLDAPVSGGVPAAEAGKMNFMVGGDPELLKRTHAVLAHLGPVIKHVGPIGSGHAIKAINMLALAASMLSTCEIVSLGLTGGANLDDLIARLDASAGASFCTRVHFPRFIVPGNYNSGFTFNLMMKDLAIGVGLAERHNMPLFLERSAFEHYRVAANTGMSGKDNTRIAEPFTQAPAAHGKTRLSPQDLEALETIAAACNLVVAAEALSLGHAAGLPRETVIDVLSAGSGDSAVLSQAVPAYLAGDAGSFPKLSEIQAAFGTYAQEIGGKAPVPLMAHAASLYASAERQFGPDVDARRVIDLISQATGQTGFLW
jgi:3-hydroxyisobutyrate dehydrogenase-like beta-hydroxyacid dehydrogenase